MPRQFFEDPKARKALRKFEKNAPKAFQRVSAGFLNRLAFDEYKNMQREISQSMTIRSSNLIKRLTQFKKTKKTIPIERQKTEAFTKTMDGHDGWEAVLTGKETKATKFTTEGRGGNNQKRSLTAARFSKSFTEPSDMGFSDTMNNKDVISYLQRISGSNTRRRKSWLLPVDFKNMPAGIYIFIGGKVLKRKSKSGKKLKSGARLVNATIKRLSDTAGVMKPDKNDWHSRATNQTLRQENVEDVFQDNFNHEFKKIRIR